MSEQRQRLDRAHRALQRGDVDLAMRELDPTIRWATRGFFLPVGAGDDSDLLQAARIGVLRAITYAPARRDGFLALVELAAKRAAATEVKNALRKKRVANVEAVSFDAPVSTVDGFTVGQVVPDQRPGPDALAEMREELAELAARLACLSGLELEVLRLQASGFSYVEICERTGARRKAIDNALQRARRKLAEPLALSAAARVRPVVGRIYIDRVVHADEWSAIEEALRVRPRATVLGLSKRKLRRGREVAPQGRRAADGSLGRAVWRVELEEAA